MSKFSWKREGGILLLAFIIIALDQLSKQWIRTTLSTGESFPPIGPLTIINIQNTGSAFGMFSNQTVILSILALAGLIAMICFYRYIARIASWGGFSLALIFAGATGNLIDRVLRGYVTDFIYVRLWGNVYWPAFNIADSCITVGTCILAISVLFTFQKGSKSSAITGNKNVPD
jgi:signal peptidase II